MTKFNIEKIVKPSIKKIAKYIPGESANDESEGFIKLSSNESPFKPPKEFFISKSFLKKQIFILMVIH